MARSYFPFNIFSYRILFWANKKFCKFRYKILFNNIPYINDGMFACRGAYQDCPSLISVQKYKGKYKKLYLKDNLTQDY